MSAIFRYTSEMCVSIATLNPRLALFHSDPLRNDAALDQCVESCRHRAVAGGRDIFAAAAGQTIERAERGAVLSRPVSQPQGAMATGVGAASATLVLVDDAPDLLRRWSMTLRPEGCRVLSASDGEAALEMAPAARPDLVLLDGHMPGRDGPVVLRTAQAEAADPTAGSGAGGTDAVTTPCQPAHLRSHVPTWLRRTRAGREGT